VTSSPWAVVPSPDATYPVRSVTPGPDESTERETWSERFVAALPLFAIGAVCLVVATLLYLEQATTAFGAGDSVHLHPWVLFVALGITGISAGTVALLVEDAIAESTEMETTLTASATRAPSKTKTPWLFGRTRRRSSSLAAEQSSVPPTSAPSAASAPSGRTVTAPQRASSRPVAAARVWDESTVSFAPHSALPKEAWDETSEEFEAAAAEPATPDVVLRQIEELEASLRKKPASPSSR
jgi:hypothetical protein